MNTSHVSEAGIQQFAINRSGASEDVIQHMQFCDRCKAKADNYLALITEISNMEKPVFDFNLAELVLEQLPVKKAQVSWISVFAMVLAVLFFTIATITFSGYVMSLFKGPSIIAFCTILASALCICLFQGIEMLKTFDKQTNAIKTAGLLQH